MNIQQIPSGIETWIEARVSPPRSEGQHVSVIVLAMLKELVPKKYGSYGGTANDREATFEIGYLWEDLLGSILSERVMLAQGETLLSSQTELCLDGIYGTPDRIVLDADGAVIIEETKATWKWYTTDLELAKFLYWIVQVKTYCAMVGALKARIRALFINEIGHSDNFVVPGCWELTFDAHELAEHWDSVKSYARRLESERGAEPAEQTTELRRPESDDQRPSA